jgi:hypothetical protein
MEISSEWKRPASHAIVARVILLEPGVAVRESESHDGLDRRLVENHIEVTLIGVCDRPVADLTVRGEAVVEDVQLRNQDLEAALR